MAIETSYNPKITPEFIMQCAKIGSVRMMSHQVIITGEDTLHLEKLAIPEGFCIERVSAGPTAYSQKQIATIVLKVVNR